MTYDKTGVCTCCGYSDAPIAFIVDRSLGIERILQLCQLCNESGLAKTLTMFGVFTAGEQFLAKSIGYLANVLKKGQG